MKRFNFVVSSFLWECKQRRSANLPQKFIFPGNIAVFIYHFLSYIANEPGFFNLACFIRQCYN